MGLKLLILDIDGVLTDGTKIYDLSGFTIAKRYCDKDFTAIKRFRAAGVQVCFLSGDNKVNEQMALNRNIDFFFSRNEKGDIDKEAFIPIFKEKYKVSENEMGYVGDDIFDLSIMKKVEYPWCPSDSPKIVKDNCNVIDAKGGENVICVLYDFLLGQNMISDASLELVKKLDRDEKF